MPSVSLGEMLAESEAPRTDISSARARLMQVCNDEFTIIPICNKQLLES